MPVQMPSFLAHLPDGHSGTPCRDAPPELFINDHNRPIPMHVMQAKALCARCPVREKCLDYAVAAGEKDGIWGGLTPEERRTLLRPRAPEAAQAPDAGPEMNPDRPGATS